SAISCDHALSLHDALPICIITMKGDEVIQNGAIIIEKNKIVAIGKATDVQIPADAKVYDATGKTIMPGIVDVHAHLHASPDGIRSEEHTSELQSPCNLVCR